MNSDVAYGHAKRVGEFLGATYAQKYGLEFKVARCFTSVGPYIPLDFNYAVGNFIRDGLSGSPIVVRGDGTPYRTYLYTSDLTIWLWNILFRGEICRPYNVGSEEAISIADLARLVAGCFRHKPEVQLLGSAVPGRQAERYVPSCARARTELALQQLIGMREAILRTARWHAPQFSASSVDSLES
jgi:dTDP-glucose 4,6-dehydratase